MTMPRVGSTPLQTFQNYRDPVEQAREMEVFMRLQQASLENFQRLNLIGNQSQQPQQPQQQGFQQPLQMSPVVVMAQPPGQPRQPAADSSQSFLQQLSSQAGDPRAGLDDMTPGELVSRAQVLGVDNADKIPAEALKNIIASRREAVRPGEDAGFFGKAAAGIALAGVGAAEGLTTLAGQVATLLTGKNNDERVQDTHNAAWGFLKGTGLDYAFDVVDRNLSIKNAHNWLAGLDEGVRANLSANDQLGGNVIGGVGTFLPYAGAGEGAFAAIGTILDTPAFATAFGRIAGSPMMRGAVQAAGTALALDSGSDKPWMPSMKDFSDMMKSGSSTLDRSEATMRLAFGSRLMDATLGGVIGGLFGMYNKSFRPSQAQAESSGWNLGNQLQLDASQEIPASYTMLRDGRVLALPRTPPPEAGGGNPMSPGPVPQPPQGPSPLRMLGAGDEGGVTYIDGQPQQSSAPGGPPMLRPPLRPEYQASVDGFQNNINADYRAVAMVPPHLQDVMAGEAAISQDFYGNLIRRYENNPAYWDRRGAMPQVSDMFNDLQSQAPQVPVMQQLTGPIKVGAEAQLRELQSLGATHPDRLPLFQNQADLVRSNLNSFSSIDRETATNMIYEHRRRIADLESAYNATINSPVPSDDMASISNKLDKEHEALLDTLARADIPKNRAPNLWDWWKQNTPTPATPARDLVDKYGTALRNSKGDPTLFFHGTGTSFQDFSANSAASGLFNDAGETAIYFTDNPVIAGGDPFGQIDESGYAANRAGSYEAERANLQIDQQSYAQSIQAFEEQGPASGISPESYQAARVALEAVTEKISQIPTPAPNVRPVFLAIKKPFEADVPMSLEDGMQIIRAAEDHPDAAPGEFNFGKVAQDWQTMHGSGYNLKPDGKQLYDLMSYAENEPGGNVANSSENWGKRRTNQVLQSLGYDAIRYKGGRRMGLGNGLGDHDAIAVFDTKHIIPAYLGSESLEHEAAQLGMSMAKQFEVMDSPLTPQISAHAEVSDADVAAAAAANHPGGLHVVQNVYDLPKLMADLQSQSFGGSYEGLIKAYRPVLHPDGHMDLLVSSLGQIPDQAVEDYAKYGLFKDMKVVVKKSGKLATIKEIYPDKVVWQSDAQAKRGAKFKTRTNHDALMPDMSSPEVIDAPVLRMDWKSYMLKNVQERVRSAGQKGYVSSMDDAEVFKRIGPLTQDFFAERGITDPGVKSAMFRYFQQEHIADIQDLDPELRDTNATIEQQIDDLNANSSDAPDLHAAARQKGYDLITDPEGGFILSDQFSPEKHRMADEAAVRAMLDQLPVDRLPDGNPSSEIPLEAAPQYSDNEAHVQPNEDTLEEQTYRDLVNELDDVDADWEFLDNGPSDASVGGGGAGSPPLPPSSGGGAQGAGNGPPEPPSRNVPVSGEPPYDPNRRPPNDQMSRREIIKRQLSGQRVLDMQHRMVKALTWKWISPARVAFANIEQDLFNAGAPGLTPWQDFDNVTSGMDQAHNFTQPFMERIGAELAKVPRQYLRDGSFARMWLMENPVDRALYATAHGFKRPAVQAMQRVESILNEMHGDTGQIVGSLKRFVAEARHNHETQMFGPNSYPDTYPEVDSFRKVASSRLMRFEKIDARSLFREYVRGYGFQKHAGDAWDKMAETWNIVKNVRIEGHAKFAPLADTMLEWQDYVKRGPEPGKDLAVRAVNRVLNTVGVPLTHGETRKLMQLFQNSMYNALQGWRVHVIVRDSSQPLLSLPTVGADNLSKAYRTAIKFGSQARNEMKQRSYDMGITQHRMPRYEGTGIFEADSPDVEASFNPLQLVLRRLGQGFGDAVRNATPAGLRQGGLAKWGPLGSYTAEGEWNRIIVGEAAHSNFMDHWQGYMQQLKIAGITGDMSLAPSPEAFVKAINGDSFRPAIARRLISQVKAGNIEGAQGALGIYMRAVADRTQFTYGARHAPLAIHTTGSRMGYAFGNFATQYGALNKEFVSYGSANHKFRAIGTLAAVMGTFEYLHRKTGWNFRNYEWWQSLFFTGSPLASAAVNTLSNANAARQVLTSSNPSSDAVNQLTQTTPTDFLSSLARTYNPVEGAIYTGGGISRAMESPTPGTALARLFITGDTRGSATDFNQGFMNGGVDLSNVPQRSVIERVPQQQQMPRSILPQTRQPGVNAHQGIEQLHQSLLNDMLDINRRYQNRNRNGDVHYAPPDTSSLGSGGGAL